MKKTVLIAMSGGVDSSVTAALLKDDGYNVIGITIQLLPRLNRDEASSQRCCGIRNIQDARDTASDLHIPHYVLNMRPHFKELVIDDFSAEYCRGRTPNPCIRCNQYIKFGILLNKADELGADYIATGHYARIEHEPDSGKYILKKAIDEQKDQSYFLYVMTQHQLQRTLMPLGLLKKNEVREIAGRKGLRVSNKPESQEICFIDGKNYRTFFERNSPELLIPGPIINKEGKVLGQHSGIVGYTVGQRRGLGISSHSPLYVISIDHENNTIMVGNRQDVYHNHLEAGDVNWIGNYSEQFRSCGSISIHAKIRSIHRPAEATLTSLDRDRVIVVFREPQWAVTPGQAVVFYDGDRVIGGGTISIGVMDRVNYERKIQG